MTLAKKNQPARKPGKGKVVEMEKSFMENSWAFSGVKSAEIDSRNQYKVEKMRETLWENNGLWDGDCYHDWFNQEVEE